MRRGVQHMPNDIGRDFVPVKVKPRLDRLRMAMPMIWPHGADARVIRMNPFPVPDANPRGAMPIVPAMPGGPCHGEVDLRLGRAAVACGKVSPAGEDIPKTAP
jgi:hypothetical protein